MASIKQTVDKSGNVVYKITANHCGKRITKSWRPNENWSAKTVQRELQKYASGLELELAGGQIETRQERLERERLEALERAKNPTLADYIHDIYMPQKELSASENTIEAYSQFFNGHLIPALGSCVLSEVTPSMINKFLVASQKNYSYGTVTLWYKIINNLFKTAAFTGVIEANPMTRVSSPKRQKGEAPQDQPKAYTVAELQNIFKLLENEPLRWRALVHLLADSGCRRGEINGLKWSDICWENGMITIQRQIQYGQGKGIYITSPKSGKSRVVSVGGDTLELLHQLRLDQMKHGNSSEWCFTKVGSADPITPQEVTVFFAAFGRKYNLPNFHPHRLRHAWASLAILGGADVASVSKALGHANPNITLNIYTHGDLDGVQRAGQIVREALKHG